MLSSFRLVVLGALAVSVSFSQDITPEKRAEVEELIQVTKVESLVTQTTANVQGQLKSMFLQQAHANGMEVTPAQQKVIDGYVDKVQHLITENLSWDRMKPNYIKLYADNFSDEELRSIIAFYKTPAGRAVLDKMPGLMKDIMAQTQQMVQGMLPQMQQLGVDMAKDLENAGLVQHSEQPRHN